MEVLVGSALGIEVSSASAFVRERAAGDHSETGFGAGRPAKSEEEEEEDNSSSGKSSSIGVPDDSDEEEEDGVVSSEDAKGGFRKGGFGSFGSLAALEDSLPIKRGLSNHFSGKSKSFNNLSEANLTEAVSSARDLEKPEHPFNKKRRILRWSKNFPLLSTAKSMPLFPLSEEDDDHREGGDDGNGDGGGEGDGDGERGKAVAGRHWRKHSVFKSSSCFALSDLHEEDEEDGDGDDEEDEEEEDGGN
ncbi:protein bfr2-like [Rhodamnia argentea]|uniref:Protein bfr2-like n=1 Tax=Rhodamnia argentea TaxID=178133 RepID=A0A8B8Q2P1_9MYRT|nr:protein bfr2-like [Rhodamnia argentea]